MMVSKQRRGVRWIKSRKIILRKVRERDAVRRNENGWDMKRECDDSVGKRSASESNKVKLSN